MSLRNLFLLVLTVGLLGLAGFFFYRHWREAGGVSDQAFFYDLSEQRLFTAARELIPPIRGLNDATEDAVRAVVVSPTGRPEDKRSWQIAYLEQYSPELKRQMEEAQAQGGSPAMGRGAAQQHRFVRRLTDRDWYSISSPEGERIVSAWASPTPEGITPVVCLP
jgi:hypothetical protein